jgi:hypothetical protein
MQHTINLGNPFWRFDYEQIKKIEPNAHYVADLAIKGKVGGWTSVPVAVFYTPQPREGYSNHYFGVFEDRKYNKLSFCDATSAAAHAWNGLERNGEVIFSRWVHDFRTFKNGGPFVDGGPEYLRIVYDHEELKQCKKVKLHLVDGVFQVIYVPDIH